MKRLCLFLALPFLLAAGELPSDWKVFQSKEGKYQVALPGKPLESHQIVRTGLGTLDVTMVLVEYKKEGSFVVSFSEFPAGAFKGADDEKRLDFARDGAIASSKGKLEGAEKKITLDKHPGREFIIEGPKGTLRTRIYAVDKRLYQTVMIGPATFIQGKDADLFFNSFKLD